MTHLRAEGPMPPERHRQPVRQARDDGAADADAEVGKAHRLAAVGREPARQQHLRGQRSAEHVAEGVEQVEEVEARQRRHLPEADQRDAGAEDPEQQQAARTVAIDQPPGQVGIVKQRPGGNELGDHRTLRAGPIWPEPR